MLWDATDKSTRGVPRLRRTAVAACCLVVLGLWLWARSRAGWAAGAAVAYGLAELPYWAWDRRRVVEARIVPGGAGGRARLRLRHAAGRTTEHDPHQVTRVLVIRDNVDGSAKLRLRLRGKRLFFGRPGSPPAISAWRESCPHAEAGARNARWGMPGIPD